jgi:ATP-binding cassette subfamily B protein
MSVFQEKEYTKQFDKNLWKKLFNYITPYRKKIVKLSFFMFGLAGIDVLFTIMTKYAVDHFVMKRQITGITEFAAIYLGLILFQVMNIYFFIVIAGKIEQGITYDIRRKSFNHLQELSFYYYDKTPIGWLMARLTSDSERLGSFISWGLVDMIWGFTLMTGISVAMLILNWKLALITMLVIPMLILVSLYFQKRILTAYRIVRKTNSKITGSFNEGINGAKTTKTLLREKANLIEFQVITSEMHISSVRAAVFSSLFLPIIMSIGSIGTGLALWFGGHRVLLEAISYGTLVAFIAYSAQFFEPLRELARIFAELQSAQASAERIFSLLDEKPEIIDSKAVEKVYGTMTAPQKENWPKMNGSIEFKDVTFAYKNGEKVLQNFNLKIEAGQTVALVGETGSGKSTIVNLACRFYEPTSGVIEIDGEDYKKKSLLWLQSGLGYVLQTPHLFSGTIQENIRYGKLNASNEEVMNAAKLVNAHEFIMNKEAGYDSEVGESGNLLSEGEKQLISFARAVLANPTIFVLDEATSSVDTETEKMIQHAIQKVLANRTSFIIAHRLSTIRSADKIIVLKDGTIIESGTHRELIQQEGYYYRLYTNQFMEEKEEELLHA